MDRQPAGDDEFEDFSKESWTQTEEDPEDARLWVSSWDASAGADDRLAANLRAELSSKAQKAAK